MGSANTSDVPLDDSSIYTGFEYYMHRDMVRGGKVKPTSPYLVGENVIDFASHLAGIPAPRAALAADPEWRGPFISTYTGRFYPFSPRASEVNIYDIAHALSMQCRYSGHGARFYSVAEHSVLVAREVAKTAPADALAGLLHDAPEALSGFGDIASPVKKRVPLIESVENKIFEAVAAFAGIAPIIPPIVHEIDGRIMADEMGGNMHECPVMHEPLGVVLQYWSPAVAEAEFLRMWNRLGGGDA